MQELSRNLQLFADDRELAMGCRMLLLSHESLSLIPQLFYLRILDLSESSAAVLAASAHIEVRSSGSVLASGSPVEVLTRLEQGRKVTSLTFSPGYAFWNASVSLTVPAGMPVSSVIRSVLEAGDTGISLAAFRAQDIRLSRPQSFFGRAAGALSVLASAAGANAFLSPAGVCVADRTPADPSLIFSEDDLLAPPVFTGDRTILSVPVTGWPLGTWSRYTWKGSSRTGRLISRMIHADNVSGPWKSELELQSA